MILCGRRKINEGTRGGFGSAPRRLFVLVVITTALGFMCLELKKNQYVFLMRHEKTGYPGVNVGHC